MVVIVLSPAKKMTGEEEIVTKLFDNGLEIYHLRKPEFSTKDLTAFLNNIPQKYWNRIVIHSKYKLAIKFGLKGIHVNKRKRKSKLRKFLSFWYYKLKRPDLHVSSSFNNLSSIFHDRSNYNYVFLSPIFDSITNSGYQSAFGHHNLKVALNKTRHKIFALGGIQTDKVDQIMAMGFTGMVLSGYLWKSENPLKSFSEVLQKVKHQMSIKDYLPQLQPGEN